MKKQLITLILMTALSGVSAQNWSTKKIKGNGNIVTQDREITSYHTLLVGGSFDVTFSTELNASLKITTDENLLNDIITEVSEGTLKIKAKKKMYLKPSKERIKIILPQTNLKKVSLSGSGKITNDTPFESPSFESKVSGSGKISILLNSDKARFNLSGSGKINVEGKTKNLFVKLSGSGAFKAKALNAEIGNVQLSGSGLAEIRCTEVLVARVSGSGKVRYFGEPTTKLDSKVGGSGSIRLAIE